MATFNIYITESKVYETTVEAPSAEAAIAAAATVDTSTLAPNIDKSVTARPA
jgi:hypothetical protein